MSFRLTHPSALLLLLTLTACGGGSQDNTAAEQSSGSAVASTNTTGALSATSTSPDEAARQIDAQVDDAATQTNQQRYLAALTVSQAAAPTYKAMWSWRDRDVYDATAQQKLLAFAVANNVTSIYVSAEWLIRDHPQQLASFITLAAGKNISVELLLAHHEWALKANHQSAIDQVLKAGAFVRTLTGAKPVALHFDVEPHSLPGWATNQVSYGNQMLDLYAKINTVKDPSLPINADMAMSYRTINIARAGVTKTLQQWLIDQTDRTTLMAYRDFALGSDSITYHADTPVAYAARRGKVTYVGVETTCGLAPEKITFCEEKRTGLNTELGKVRTRYAGNTGFGGLVVHDYAGYSVLP